MMGLAALQDLEDSDALHTVQLEVHQLIDGHGAVLDRNELLGVGGVPREVEEVLPVPNLLPSSVAERHAVVHVHVLVPRFAANIEALAVFADEREHCASRALPIAVELDLVVDPDEVPRAVRRAAGTRVIGSTLGSGVDVTIDAVGSSSSLTDAISITRPRGRVVLLGMPAEVNLNLTALWHRETALVGAYCYGSEHSHGGAHTFSLAEELVREHDLGQLVSAIYPLADYREAIEHAAQAGPRGSVKIAFDLRETPEA